MALEVLKEDEELDPILSVVNLVDVFLVVIVALMMMLAINPLNPLVADNVMVITNPGEDNMEILIKDGQRLERFQASDEIGEGEGIRAGITYRMRDGSFVYVPEPGVEP
ncbi:MAG: DUF2149 domain-containing protein [Chromatiales bacterium]|nr:DUF2149 domain-containing protein [Chromatiales bacterium]